MLYLRASLIEKNTKKVSGQCLICLLTLRTLAEAMMQMSSESTASQVRAGSAIY